MLKNNSLQLMLRVTLVAAFAWVLAGCDQLPFGYTSIKEITTAPANFEGKEIKIKGKVNSIAKLPLLDLKAYTLQDETGEISITTLGALPAVNDRVALRGTVKSTAIIGGQALGLRVDEIRRF